MKRTKAQHPWARRLRRWFLAGILALAPLFITVLVIEWVLGLGGKLLALLPAGWQPEAWLGVQMPLLGVLAALGFVLLVGAITSHLLGARVMHMIDRIMERIPLVRTLHRATRQLLDAVLREDAQAFQQVVLAPFPGKSARVIGFVTGHLTLPDEGRLASVFVPSTPVPSTGWLLFVKPEELVPLAMSIDDAMKLVLSGGALIGEVKEQR